LLRDLEAGREARGFDAGSRGCEAAGEGALSTDPCGLGGIGAAALEGLLVGCMATGCKVFAEAMVAGRIGCSCWLSLWASIGLLSLRWELYWLSWAGASAGEETALLLEACPSIVLD